MLTAASGIYICLPVEEKSSINLGKAADKKLVKGKIVSVGKNRQHDSSGEMVAEYKVGDIIYFISYESAYDWFEEKGQKYYCVLFHDTRAKI